VEDETKNNLNKWIIFRWSWCSISARSGDRSQTQQSNFRTKRQQFCRKNVYLLNISCRKLIKNIRLVTGPQPGGKPGNCPPENFKNTFSC